VRHHVVSRSAALTRWEPSGYRVVSPRDARSATGGVSLFIVDVRRGTAERDAGWSRRSE
jgi:hypothetical protein